MKTFILITLLAPIFILGQITISKNNFPDNNDEYIYSNASINSIDVSQTGANSIWDYSQLIHLNFDSLTHVSVGSTPLAYQINFNIPFSSYKADYAIKGDDFQSPDPNNSVSITDVFNFHKKNNSSIEMVGFGANVNGLPASIKYDIKDQLYPLPMTFGTSDSTSARYLFDVPTLGAYGQQIEREVEVDGWGELITPYQTYNNTIRVKTILHQRDTLKIEQPFPLPGLAFNRPVETKYEWFTTGVGAPVFSVTQQASIITNAKYIDINTTSITENSTFDFTIFPNPAKETINISIPFEKANMQIIDINGKIIYNGQFLNTINISKYTNGSYIVIVSKNNEKAYQYFQKI